MTPRRWHVYIVDLEPRIGTKPDKQRPCLAIQPPEFGEGGLRSTVVLLEFDSGRLLHELATTAPIGGLAFRSQGQLLLTADWNGLVTFWDVTTGQVRGHGRAPKDAVSEANFSPDNDALSGVTMLDPVGADSEGTNRAVASKEF